MANWCRGIVFAGIGDHFAPTQYEDPIGALFKLTQKGSIADYLFEFEALANCIVGLPPPFLLSCFISGLAAKVR